MKTTTTRVAFFGTHIVQSNGYSKVVYELMKGLGAHEDVELFLFGFQKDRAKGNTRDVPPNVTVFDAAAYETPLKKGFGFHLVKDFMALAKPDVVVIFNDLMVIKLVMDEIEAFAPRPRDFKVIAYIDQVYGSQNRALIEMVNRCADAAIAFTPSWKDCIVKQGLRLPCDFLPHGLDPMVYYPIPREAVRRYYALPESDYIVLNLNRNQPRKRWDVCLQAWAEFVGDLWTQTKDSSPSPSPSPQVQQLRVRLLVATAITGYWNLLDVYKRELAKRGVPEDVGMRCIQFIDAPQKMSDREINLLYNLCDVGINTCDGEGFGLCSFEHAAVGKPQIVSDVGGLHDIFGVAQGEKDENDTEQKQACATLVKPCATFYTNEGEAQMCSHVDFARALRFYYDHAEEGRKHGASARKRILRDFRWPAISQKLHDIVVSTRSEKEPSASDIPITPPPPTTTTCNGEETTVIVTNTETNGSDDFSFPTLPQGEKGEEGKDDLRAQMQQLMKAMEILQRKL